MANIKVSGKRKQPQNLVGEGFLPPLWSLCGWHLWEFYMLSETNFLGVNTKHTI